MLQLKRGQRTVLVEELPDFANLAAGTLFFGQFLSDRAFSMALAVFGSVVWVGLMACVMVLAAREIDR